MRLRCGSRLVVDGTEVTVEALRCANSAVLAVLVSFELDGELVKVWTDLPAGVATV